MSIVIDVITKAEALLAEYALSLDMFYTVHITGNEVKLMGNYASHVVKSLSDVEWTIDNRAGMTKAEIDNITITLW